MEKVMGIISCVIGVLLIVFGIIMKIQEKITAVIIGKADGPTSVYIAGKLNSDIINFLMLTGSILLAIVLISYLKRKH